MDSNDWGRGDSGTDWPARFPVPSPQSLGPQSLLDKLYPKNISMRGAFVLRPAWVDASIAAVEGAVVPGESMRIRIGLGELHGLERPARFGFVLDEPGALLVSGHHPDGALSVPGDAVCARHVVWDQEFRLPRLRIHSENPAQPERGDPELSVHVLDAVAAAATKRDLAMRDRLRAHVRLKDPVRCGIRAHPDVAATDPHPAGVLRFGFHRFQQLALPIHETRVVRFLLANPQAVGR